jgi:Fe-S-cluster-containing hydrogenase component 2
MDYETGFCEYDCNLCGRICPTGAILSLDIQTKQKTQIGRAHLIKERCVVYTKETACGACAEVCPTHAVHMVPYLPRLNQPETDQTLCIGCGNCQFACPVIGTKAILVEGRADHIPVDDRKDRPPKGKAAPDEAPTPAQEPPSPEKKEFPF